MRRRTSVPACRPSTLALKSAALSICVRSSDRTMSPTLRPAFSGGGPGSVLRTLAAWRVPARPVGFLFRHVLGLHTEIAAGSLAQQQRRRARRQTRSASATSQALFRRGQAPGVTMGQPSMRHLAMTGTIRVQHCLQTKGRRCYPSLPNEYPSAARGEATNASASAQPACSSLGAAWLLSLPARPAHAAGPAAALGPG